MKAKPMPSAEEIRAALDYDPAMGVLRWRYRAERSASWNTRYAGKAAGSENCRGYLIVRFRGEFYQASRMAWIYVNGGTLDEDDEVDHRDGRRADNRIENLRLATRGQNVSNSKQRKGKSLPKGVTRQRSGDRFIARIGFDRRVLYLGVYDTAAQAHDAYVDAAVMLKGEFARAA